MPSKAGAFAESKGLRLTPLVDMEVEGGGTTHMTILLKPNRVVSCSETTETQCGPSCAQGPPAMSRAEQGRWTCGFGVRRVQWVWLSRMCNTG